MAEAHIVAHAGCCITPQSLRLLNNALVCQEGVAFDNAYGTDSLEVTASGESLGVVVAAGSAFVAGGDFAGEGMYFVSNDAPVTLTLDGADPADPRCDLVIAQVDGTATDCEEAWILTTITGVPAPEPTCPTAPAGALPLATVSVGAGATAITAADISDQRQAYESCTTPSFPYEFMYNQAQQDLNRPLCRDGHHRSRPDRHRYRRRGDTSSRVRGLTQSPTGKPVGLSCVPVLRCTPIVCTVEHVRTERPKGHTMHITEGMTVTVEHTRGQLTPTPTTRTVTGIAYRDDEGTLRVDSVNLTRDNDGYFPAGVVVISAS